MIVYNINKDISEVYLGDNSISEVYIGDEKVFPQTPVSYKYRLTLSDSSVVSADCDSNSRITSADTSAYKSSTVKVEIGDCVGFIGDGAFYQFSGLTSATLSSIIPRISDFTFGECSNLASVNIPNVVQSIGQWSFGMCTSLSSVTIPNSVERIYNTAFYGCSGLTEITIPNSVERIDDYAFNSCSGLTSITVEAIVPPTLGNGVFDNTNQCPIYVACESVNAYKTATNWSNYADRIQCVEPQFSGKYKFTLSDSSVVSAECDSSTAITTAETSAYESTMVEAEFGDCVTSIGESAFYYFTSLTSVAIPNSIKIINRGAFNRCENLTYVTIGSDIMYIYADAFRNCTSLTSVTINADTPPRLMGAYVFFNTNNCPIYVPSQSVEAYKTATEWRTYADRIQPIL